MEEMTLTKICSKCHHELPAINVYFSMDGGCKHGLHSVCKDCVNKNSKKRNKGNIEERRIDQLLRRHNLLGKEYNAMFEQQGGCCDICHKPEIAIDKRTGKIRKLAVDHNHKNNKNRGLLCSNCNGRMGWYEKHDTEINKYLERYK